MKELQSSKDYQVRFTQIIERLSKRDDLELIDDLIELNKMFDSIVSINESNLNACERLLFENDTNYRKVKSCLEAIEITHNGKTENFDYWFYKKMQKTIDKNREDALKL